MLAPFWITKLCNWVVLTYPEMCQALEKTNRRALTTRTLETLSSTPYKPYQELVFKQVIMDNASHMDGMGNDVKPPSWNAHLPSGCPQGVGTGLLLGCSRKVLF